MQTRQHASISEWARSLGSKAETRKGQIASIRAAIAKTKSIFTPNLYQPCRRVTRAEWEKQAHDKRLAVHMERAREFAGVGKAQLDALAASMASTWPLRRAESRWAGGDHYVHITLGDTPACECDMTREWSKNGKWSGHNSHARLRVTAAAVVLFPTLRTPDGGIVLDARMVAPREYRLTWVTQGRGTAISPTTGWYIRGYHSTAATLETARKEAAKARKKTLSIRLGERQKKIDATRVFVEFDDSIRAGNCRAMTEQVARKVWDAIGAVGPCAVRADVLVGQRNDVYSRRAIAAAAQR